MIIVGYLYRLKQGEQQSKKKKKNESRNGSTHAWSPDLRQVWSAIPGKRERIVFSINNV